MFSSVSLPLLQVRRVALARLASDAQLAAAAVARQFPIAFLWHRYQVACAAKAIGGLQFRYTSGPGPARPVPVPQQERALRAVLSCVSLDALRVPAGLLLAVPPPTPHFINAFADPFTDPREDFARPGGRDRLDPYAAAYAAATLVFQSLLAPERAARLVAQEQAAGTGDEGFGLYTMLSRCAHALFEPGQAWGSSRGAERMAAQVAFWDALAALRRDAQTAPCRAVVDLFAGRLRGSLRPCADNATGPFAEACLPSGAGALWEAHYQALKWPHAPPERPLQVPMGPPI